MKSIKDMSSGRFIVLIIFYDLVRLFALAASSLVIASAIFLPSSDVANMDNISNVKFNCKVGSNNSVFFAS